MSSTISGGSLPPIPNLGERVSSGTTDDRREFSRMAKWALRLSIAGLVVPLILHGGEPVLAVGIAGGIMGIIAHRRDKREGRRYGYAQAAWIIQVVVLLLGIIIAIAAPSEASTSTPLPPRVERLQAAPDPAPVLEPEAEGGVTRRQARDLLHSLNDVMRAGGAEGVSIRTDNEDGGQQLASYFTIPHLGYVTPGDWAHRLLNDAGYTVVEGGNYGTDAKPAEGRFSVIN